MLRYTGRIDDGEKPGTAKTHDTRNALDALWQANPCRWRKQRLLAAPSNGRTSGSMLTRRLEEWAKEKVSIEELDLDQLKTLLKNDGINYKLINVWATWCGPCVTEFPEFVNMNRMYRNREFEMISISMDELNRKPNALNFLTKKQASMKNYIFKGDKYAFIEGLDKKWEGSLPYTLFIAPGGKIIYGKQGLIEPLELKKIIAENIGRIY